MIESAEVGVAAYSTVHSRSVPETLSRVLHVFPRDEQPQIAATLISSLRLIISQRLLPHPSGEGRTALREYLPFTAEIRETLLETPPERLIPVTQELLEAHGQKLRIPAKAAFEAGKISKDRYLGIEAERKHKGRSYGEPSEQEATAWPTYPPIYPMTSYGAIPVWLPKSSFWTPAPFSPSPSGFSTGPGGQQA
jgi:defect-in-organelle-trafficking protein DotB